MGVLFLFQLEAVVQEILSLMQQGHLIGICKFSLLLFLCILFPVFLFSI